MMVDEQYGGGGMDTKSYVLAMEEISKVDASASVCMSGEQLVGVLGVRAVRGPKRKKKSTLHRWLGRDDRGVLFVRT